MWSDSAKHGRGSSRTRALLTVSATIVTVALISLGYAAAAYAASSMQISTTLSISVCGDGIIQPDEVCDDGAGNNTGGYGDSIADRHCDPDCQGFGPYCGDGILQVRFGEQCDDGNNISGDLCSATCQSETPVLPSLPPPPPTGSPAVGSIPSVPGGSESNISAQTPTEVVLRGKAYPNSTVSILLDGQTLGSVQADSNADFLYTTMAVSPGTETFSFSASDDKGVASLLESVVFEVVQSAVTTVANVFLPPSIALSATTVAPGDLLTISGQSVPYSQVTTQIDAQSSSTLVSTVDASGDWALQLDTGSITTGNHTAKASFLLGTSTQSGFGQSVSFLVGSGSTSCSSSPDLNSDKKVNLIDFSIFLTLWGTGDPRGDFNCDGQVNLADFSIMLFNWTG